MVYLHKIIWRNNERNLVPIIVWASINYKFISRLSKR
nr:MAG TPA: hypothetical protein [Caudoviricetes sp.]